MRLVNCTRKFAYAIARAARAQSLFQRHDFACQRSHIHCARTAGRQSFDSAYKTRNLIRVQSVESFFDIGKLIAHTRINAFRAFQNGLVDSDQFIDVFIIKCYAP